MADGAFNDGTDKFLCVGRSLWGFFQAEPEFKNLFPRITRVLYGVSERETYLTPAGPGCEHVVADAAEECLSPTCRSIYETRQ